MELDVMTTTTRFFHSERRSAASDLGYARINARVRAGLRRAFCRLQGHDNLLHFGTARMFLKCTSCGRESPGWTIRDTRPPGRRSDGHTRTSARRHLVHLRRTA
jgi:hypothetical protein